MSATNLMEDKLLALLMQNTAAANIGDAGGLQPSAAEGVFWISLHTGAAVGDTSTDQDQSEATYSPYARISAARNATVWAVTAGVADNISELAFAQCDGGTETLTTVGLGFASTGPGELQLYGALTGGGLAVSPGIKPRFQAGALDIALD